MMISQQIRLLGTRIIVNICLFFRSKTRHSILALRTHHRLPPVFIEGQKVPSLQRICRRQKKGIKTKF